MKPPYRKRTPLKDPKEMSKLSMRKLRTKKKEEKTADIFIQWLKSNCVYGDMVEITQGPNAFVVVKVKKSQ